MYTASPVSVSLSPRRAREEPLADSTPPSLACSVVIRPIVGLLHPAAAAAQAAAIISSDFGLTTPHRVLRRLQQERTGIRPLTRSSSSKQGSPEGHC